MATYLKSLLPPAATFEGWKTIDDSKKWAKIPDDMLKAFCVALGEEELVDLHVFAALEPEDVRDIIKALCVTVVKRTRLNLLLNAIRAKFGLELVDLSKPQSDGQASSPPGSVGAVPFAADGTAIDGLIKAAQAKAAQSLVGTVRLAHVIDQA